MWMYHAMVAIDLANQRAREAERATLQWRLAQDQWGEGWDAPGPRFSRVRAWLARPVRSASHVMHAVSEATCTIATRIEGRPA